MLRLSFQILLHRTRRCREVGRRRRVLTDHAKRDATSGARFCSAWIRVPTWPAGPRGAGDGTAWCDVTAGLPDRRTAFPRARLSQAASLLQGEVPV